MAMLGVDGRLWGGKDLHGATLPSLRFRRIFHNPFKAILLAFIVLFAFLNTVKAEVSKPVYNIGDHWEYSAVMVLQPNLTLDGRINMEITGVGILTVLDTTYDVYQDGVDGNGTFHGSLQGAPVSGGWTMDGTEHWDKTSLERVTFSIMIELSGEMTFQQGKVNFTMSIENTTANMILSDTWLHPFDVGDSGLTKVKGWSNETFRIEIEGFPPQEGYTNYSFEEDAEYDCLRKESVHVGAGTFSTYVVNRSQPSIGYQVKYYYPGAGAGAKILEYNRDGTKIGEWELLSFSYRGEVADLKFLGISLSIWSLIAIIVIVILAVVIYFAGRKRAG